jgi:hypothetical protein
VGLVGPVGLQLLNGLRLEVCTYIEFVEVQKTRGYVNNADDKRKYP